MKVTNYVKLPILKKVEIKNYSLFNSNWDYTLKAGMNIFLGTNGLGKTTTTNLIIYGMVGYNNNISADYFQNRGSKTDDTAPAVVSLEFMAGEHNFVIHRRIEEDTIEYLKVDDEEYFGQDVDNLDEAYEALLVKYSDISSIGDIEFLLHKFLVREEEGNYLLWDNKGGDQSRLIRILVNNSGFEHQYAVIAKEVKDLDTIVRGKTDVKAQFTKRLEELKVQKEIELNKRTSHNQLKAMMELLENTQSEYDKFSGLRDKNLDSINYLLNNIKDLESKMEVAASDFEGKSERVSVLESKLFNHVYSDEKVLTAIHKLKHYNICIYCNKTPKEDVVKEIVKKLEIQNQCPVCESHLDSLHPDLENDDVLKELEIIQSQLTEFRLKNDELQRQRDALKGQLDEVWREQDIVEKNVNGEAIKLYDLRLKISNLKKNPDEQITIYDNEILAMQSQIAKYDLEIAPAKEKFDKAKKKLDDKNDQQTSVITSFEEDLNKIYENYTSKFFSSKCNLTIISRKPKESNVNVTSYVPEFDGKKRSEIKSCSTSQRIFLEYLFRLSIIELYSEKSGNTPFIMMETTEGAFDITNTIQLASSFNEFAANKIPFVLICNFSKPDFLSELVKGIQYSKENVLNYLDFGNVPKQHVEHLKDYKDIIKKLKLV
ncbi:hypothetical protein [Pedobacter agri]|uniref:hypothetical protein n=1 Tax=Pedobacter agri TaxID=454586 RepID=UPI00292E0541|nr:hypothetical protein [Pedobacter agri]